MPSRPIQRAGRAFGACPSLIPSPHSNLLARCASACCASAVAACGWTLDGSIALSCGILPGEKCWSGAQCGPYLPQCEPRRAHRSAGRRANAMRRVEHRRRRFPTIARAAAPRALAQQRHHQRGELGDGRDYQAGGTRPTPSAELHRIGRMASLPTTFPWCPALTLDVPPTRRRSLG
jgi:hypothetical protein